MKTPQGHTAEAVSYTWDTGGLSGTYGVGRLNAIVDASGTTSFKYDHRGNLLVQQQAIGTSPAAQLAYVYDLGDHITQITYPSGQIVQYDRDTKGRMNIIRTQVTPAATGWTVIADNFTYEPFASVKAMRLMGGLSVANDWGNNGRLASRRLYQTSGGANLSSLIYSYDNDDNIGAITDALDDTRSVYYGYDSNDRLSRTLLTAGTVATGTDTYSYATATNQLASIANASGTRSFGYDARGNLASESRPGGISATTTYDSYGRLTGYVRTDVGTLSFVYNGRDDRVAETSGTGTRHFVYDPDGRVLGEYGASATDVKAEYVWARPSVANDTTPFGGDDGTGGYMPLAVLTPDTTGVLVLNYVHGNHLGVPIVATDVNGAVATTPNDYLAPGFPGQSRTIADLYYNRYRDYDPTTGRYIQADPIGLNGGQNNYVYAANNPISWSDPWGLLSNSPPSQSASGATTPCGCRTVRILVTSYNDHGPGSDWAYYKKHPGGVGPNTIAVANTNPKPYPYGSTFNVLNPDGSSAYSGTAYDTGAGWNAAHHNVDPAHWIDIWLPGPQANKWGLQWRNVTICGPK